MKGLLYLLADWRLHNKMRACQFPDKPSRILHLITYVKNLFPNMNFLISGTN